AQINGAPLSAGTHRLYLMARDSQGLTSAPTVVQFTLDLTTRAAVATSSSYNAATNTYDYQFTASGPSGNGWALDKLAVPVPTNAAVSNLVTPSGWSATYTAGAASVLWQATAPGAALA